MNSSRYILARIAAAFGIHRKNRRLSEAADEMHLLRQAEEILGEDTWEQTEGIEALNSEYWNLRKLQMSVGKLEKAIEEADAILQQSHDERNSILNHSNEVCQVIETERDELVRELEQLNAKRDKIVSRAQLVKRNFEASRTKVMVLTGEEDEGGSDHQEVIREERAKLSEYKASFDKLKKGREEVGVQISELEAKISELETQIETDRKRHREEASGAYQNIGKANRDKSKLTAEVGLLEAEMTQHFSEIGRYISNHAGTDPICTKICKEHAHLIAQMQTLHTSIALNHKLAAIADA
ncbi:hypothetical protein JIN77_05815 [Verrucomicrobiaceae bacterium R5-34]|uniref:Uncharacterized protein n=1 Tax=Oceaniferula flava TaxID=2800421 RepID=A0AAE2SB03_9BACT|nr:hypothetical protein [Oceaniferula flavus]MBK1830230.1 hypothetical protein [Verrucomicrobiaceae bacterium R5-34]MBK1854821.1 hypothetical protein [Oceaniferula flavus]MBM1136127.1 hypothetical protein [Oceaniferula flavus]